MGTKLIKVCGMRDPENIRAVESLGIDLMGFIFYPKSPRYCAEVPSHLPTKCKRVGVFVNAEDSFIADRVEAFGLDVLQLHGDETPTRIAEIKRRFHLPVIKAVNWPCEEIAGNGTLIDPAHDTGGNWTLADPGEVIAGNGTLAETCDKGAGNGDLLLFETKCEGYGGSGRQFDWAVLEDYDGETPFLLTGGIGPEDAERVRTFRHPRFVGIDLNSRFEIEPGVKDVQLVEGFLKTIRK